MEGKGEGRQGREGCRGRRGMACVRVHGRKKAERLQKMVMVYLPREEGISQRVT